MRTLRGSKQSAHTAYTAKASKYFTNINSRIYLLIEQQGKREVTFSKHFSDFHAGVFFGSVVRRAVP